MKASRLVKVKFGATSAGVFLLLLGMLYSAPALTARTPREPQAYSRGVKVNDDPKAKVASELSGHYFALVIGINNYQHLPKLSTAAPDAQALAALLRSRYGFQTTVLVDATRDQITKALNDYRHNLDENSSLLIYYAGHGIYDKEADKAYWLPVDAERDDTSRWIMADEVTTAMKVIPARHVLIVSDSCYSGGMTREIAPVLTSQERDRFLEKMAVGKSRTLMSSGALEPVSDAGGNGHSAFTGALLQALTNANDPVFSAGGVFEDYIQVAVAGRSDQTPQYVPVRNSGHDFGDFIFVRSGKAPDAGAVAKVTPAASPNPPASVPQPARATPPTPPVAPARGGPAAPNRALYDSFVGEYDFGAIVNQVRVDSNGALTAQNTGQQAVELEATGELQYNAKGVPGFSVEFRRDASGATTEMVSHQPAGIFVGERRSGEKLDAGTLRSLLGNYSNGVITVNLASPREGELSYFVPGQPLWSLRYTHGMYFMVSGVLGVSLDFRRAANGEISELVEHMPTGDITFQRKR